MSLRDGGLVAERRAGADGDRAAHSRRGSDPSGVRWPRPARRAWCSSRPARALLGPPALLRSPSPSPRVGRALPVTARLGLVALGILAALGLAEGILRVAAAVDPRVRLMATGRSGRPTVRY